MRASYDDDIAKTSEIRYYANTTSDAVIIGKIPGGEAGQAYAGDGGDITKEGIYQDYLKYFSIFAYFNGKNAGKNKGDAGENFDPNNSGLLVNHGGHLPIKDNYLCRERQQGSVSGYYL